MWPDIHHHHHHYHHHHQVSLIKQVVPSVYPAEPEPEYLMAAPLLCMLMMCTKLRNNLRIKCSVLMSVIQFMLLHIVKFVMHNVCLFECLLVLKNDLEPTRFCNIHAVMLLCRQAYCGF